MLREKIKSEMIDAMKAHNDAKTSILRMINSSIKDKDIAARPKADAISDDEILSLLQSMIKQRKESIEMYKQGNRSDLVEAEQAEIDIINQFLPQQMSEEETKTAISTVIQSVGATSIKDMGKVMAALKAQYAGKMDFALASQQIKALLS